MGFDDLARHMAARDKKKLSKAGSAAAIVAEAGIADRRMARQRDLILGPILLIGGLALTVLVISLVRESYWPTTTPTRVQGGVISTRVLTMFTFGALALLIAGTLQTLRGLRGRSTTSLPAD